MLVLLLKLRHLLCLTVKPEYKTLNLVLTTLLMAAFWVPALSTLQLDFLYAHVNNNAP